MEDELDHAAARNDLAEARRRKVAAGAERLVTPGKIGPLVFDTDDPHFRRGFEVGRVDAALEIHSNGVFNVSADIVEMLNRVAVRHGLRMQVLAQAPAVNLVTVHFAR